MVDDLEETEERKITLRKFMVDRGVKASEWARMAGLTNANAIYNFLNGQSKSLSYETYQRLASVFPGVTVAQLTGEKPIGMVSKMVTIVVKGSVRAGRWASAVEYDLSEQFKTAIPVTGNPPPGLYGLAVEGLSMNKIYPPGTILAVVPFWQFTQSRRLRSGIRVIVHRYRHDEVEATVKEIVFDSDGRPWLVARSTEPEFQHPIAIPAIYDGGPFADDGIRIEIVGVVFGAFQLEPM